MPAQRRGFRLRRLGCDESRFRPRLQWLLSTTAHKTRLQPVSSEQVDMRTYHERGSRERRTIQELVLQQVRNTQWFLGIWKIYDSSCSFQLDAKRAMKLLTTTSGQTRPIANCTATGAKYSSIFVVVSRNIDQGHGSSLLKLLGCKRRSGSLDFQYLH